MKIAIILGRGTEGCGVTQCAIQMQRVSGADIYSTKDKRWPRAKGFDFPVTEFSMAKEWEKYTEIVNKYDLCVIYSVPSTGHPEACQENFLKFLNAIKIRKAFINVDHKMASISRNANLKEVCGKVDVMMTHSMENDFCKYMTKHAITTPVCKMGLGFSYDEHRKKYWKPIDEQQGELVRWIGRTTGWKGPGLMIDYHADKLKDLGFITVLEGLEASISYTSILYKDDACTQRRDVVNYFRPEKEHGDEKFDPSVYGKETLNKGAYLYPPYINQDAMERMSLSGFGSDLYHLSEKSYGNNIENCHAEIIACGSVPIFHKHFCDNVIHKVQGDPITKCKNSGTIALDYSNFDEASKIMKKLKNDSSMRDDWREMAFEFWKQHSDAKDVVSEIIKLATDNITETKKSTLEDLFA